MPSSLGRGSATCELCDLAQVPSPLCFSAFSWVRWKRDVDMLHRAVLRFIRMIVETAWHRVRTLNELAVVVKSRFFHLVMEEIGLPSV